MYSCLWPKPVYLKAHWIPRTRQLPYLLCAVTSVAKQKWLFTRGSIEMDPFVLGAPRNKPILTCLHCLHMTRGLHGNPLTPYHPLLTPVFCSSRPAFMDVGHLKTVTWVLLTECQTSDTMMFLFMSHGINRSPEIKWLLRAGISLIHSPTQRHTHWFTHTHHEHGQFTSFDLIPHSWWCCCIILTLAIVCRYFGSNFLTVDCSAGDWKIKQYLI